MEFPVLWSDLCPLYCAYCEMLGDISCISYSSNPRVNKVTMMMMMMMIYCQWPLLNLDLESFDMLGTRESLMMPWIGES